MATSSIGRDTPRVDGPLKVSGKAQYASDFHFPGMLYAMPVAATRPHWSPYFNPVAEQSMRSVSCSFDISSEKIATAMLACSAACVAMLRASAVFPMPGRPATMIKSER